MTYDGSRAYPSTSRRATSDLRTSTTLLTETSPNRKKTNLRLPRLPQRWSNDLQPTASRTQAVRFRAQAQVSPPADHALATDIHAELKSKALEARDRLVRSNAPKRASETIDRLLADLGVTVGDVSPGKLLMRSRSLEADVAAYDTVEARREIAEDALAQVIDVAASVTDLKSCYPAITRLEAARVAQDLLTKTSARHSSKCPAIREVAAASEVVDPSAVEALKVGEPEIKHADEIKPDKGIGDEARVIATEKRAETAAQMLLDHRNFVASVLKTASTLYEKAKPSAAAIARESRRSHRRPERPL